MAAAGVQVGLDWRKRLPLIVTSSVSGQTGYLIVMGLTDRSFHPEFVLWMFALSCGCIVPLIYALIDEL